MGFVADAVGGIGDFLFGSEGDPAQVIDVTDPKFKELRPPVSNALQDLIRSGGGGSFGATNALTAGITGPEQAILNQLGTGGLSNLQEAGRGQLLNTIEGGNLQGNPFLQQAIQAATRPVIDRFTDVTLPGVVGQFKNAGQTIRSNPNQPGSSQFLNQVRLADRDLSRTVGDIASKISFENFQQERQRQEAGIRTAEDISTQDIDNAIKNLQAQALPRFIEDLGIQRGIAEFDKQIARLLQSLGLAGPLAQGVPPQTIPGTEGTGGLLSNIGINLTPSFGG